MTKIYLVKYNNGEDYEDYEDYTFKYCYSSKQQAQQAIEELQQDQDFLDSINPFDTTNIKFWIESIDLIN